MEEGLLDRSSRSFSLVVKLCDMLCQGLIQLPSPGSFLNPPSRLDFYWGRYPLYAFIIAVGGPTKTINGRETIIACETHFSSMMV